MRTLTTTRLLAALVLAVVAAACGMRTGTPSIHWTCTALAQQQHFKGYGITREQAFESAMDECKSSARDSLTCIGDPEKCMPPKGQN